MVPRTEMMMRMILMGAEMMMMRMVTRREMMMMRMRLMGAEREEKQLLAKIKLNDIAQQQDSSCNMRSKSRILMVMMTTPTKNSIKVDDNGNK